ncbi:DUF397 domain-containing protein [Nocardia sp. ET3-3]|uniref:DUF397 domain-containing protein n=1 Tax=Nocardia terrae TaxID=2675851 RepID=A0A7K1VAX8_9NOCA|nr:DUF397 domain-containing protein [Nocardia terrae]
MNDDPTRVRWFKSSYSQGGSDCVEVAFLDGGEVGVRDSKDPTGPALVFAMDEWEAFAAGAGSGKLRRR